MSKKIVERSLYVIGALIIIFAIIIDPIRGKQFTLGWIQICMLLAGIDVILMGFLWKKGNPRVIFFLVFFSMMIVFGILKYQIYTLDTYKVWTDTESYIKTSLVPMNQSGFWMGERPFVLPLFYKLFGLDLVNYWDRNFAVIVLAAQSIISYLVWSFFAYSISKQFTNTYVKMASIVVVFSLGLGLHNSMWDKLMLSESLSNSFLILIVSILLLLFSNKEKSKSWQFVLGSVFLVINIALYLFVRDSNATFVFLGGVVGAIWWLIDKQKGKRVTLVLSSLGILLSILAIALMNNSTRWWTPLQHAVYDRQSSVPSMQEFFKRNGVDLAAITPYLRDPQVFGDEPVELADKDQVLRQVKTIYGKYLLSHPRYTLLYPLPAFKGIMTPLNTEYRYTQKPTPSWVTAITDFFYPKGNWIYPVGVLCLCLWFFLSGRKIAPALVIFLFLILSVFPLGLLIWHSDTMELDRHAQQFMIQSRIGFWSSILFLVDTIICRVRSTSK